MGVIDRFNSFAAEFETAIRDDDWSGLEKYFARDATYYNVGGPDPKCEGVEAVLNYLKNDVANFDRRFDTRTLIAVTPPATNGNHLSRRWRCIYTLEGAPDLVVEGEARYLFERELIKEIEEEPNSDSVRIINEWMRIHAGKLHA